MGCREIGRTIRVDRDVEEEEGEEIKIKIKMPRKKKAGTPMATSREPGVGSWEQILLLRFRWQEILDSGKHRMIHSEGGLPGISAKELAQRGIKLSTGKARLELRTPGSYSSVLSTPVR